MNSFRSTRPAFQSHLSQGAGHQHFRHHQLLKPVLSCSRASWGCWRQVFQSLELGLAPQCLLLLTTKMPGSLKDWVQVSTGWGAEVVGGVREERR